jgi:hypothetical protein
MYGTSPDFVETSMWNYCLYYCAIIPFRFDPKTGKTIKAERAEIIRKSTGLFWIYLLTMLAYSIVVPLEYAPFPSPKGGPQSWPSSFLDLFHWGYILNNFVAAYITSLSLTSASLGVGLGISLLTGTSTIDAMDSPLFKSSSPSDFWGRRWNLVVHDLFKVRRTFVPGMTLPKYVS